MNKLICSYNKRKGTFKRVNCELCTYSSRCQDLHEYQQGHDDEQRASIHASEDVARDSIGKI